MGKGKLKALLATFFFSLIPFVSSCDAGRIKTRTIYKEPLFAHYREISTTGRFLVLEDDRDETRDDILSFDVQKKLEKLLLEASSDREYFPEETLNNKIIIREETHSPTQRDLIVCDLESGEKDFGTNTDDCDEYFWGIIENQKKALITKFDTVNLQHQILTYDPSTKTLENLFPNADTAYITSYYDAVKKMIQARDSSGYPKVYCLDMNTGNLDLLLDLTGIATQVFFESKPEIVAYATSSEIVFQKIGGNATSFNKIDPINNNYYPTIISEIHDQTMIFEENWSNQDKRYFYFDIDTGASQEIDLSSFTGWEPTNFSNSFIYGSDKILMFGNNTNNPSIPEILFYNQNTNSVEDLITPLVSSSGTPLYYGLIEYKDKALIDVCIDTGTDIIDKFFLFDGTTVTEILNSYQNARWDVFSRKPGNIHKYVAFVGRNNNIHDLILFDFETSTTKIIDTAQDYIAAKRFSPDSTKLVFITKDSSSWDDLLNIYDLTSDTIQRNIIQSSDIRVRDFSKDGTKIAYTKGRHDKLHVLDLNTLEETFVCYN